MRTLVACACHSRKEYSFDLWEQATSSYHRVVALEKGDNSRIIKRVKRMVDVVMFEPIGEFCFSDNPIYGDRFNEAYASILTKCGGYTHMLSLDSDVIPPKGSDILSVMESECDPEYDFIVHGVPWRNKNRKTLAYETSCTLGSVEAWGKALSVCSKGHNLYRAVRDFKCKDFHSVDMQHLDASDVAA